MCTGRYRRPVLFVGVEMKELNQEMPQSPVQPIELGIACFNKCCESIEITLTPYDIIRLKGRLKLTS
jgi:uncharacterized protein